MWCALVGLSVSHAVVQIVERAERKRECESVSEQRAEVTSLHFLRGSGFLRELQAARQHQSCFKWTGRAVRKVCELARA